MLNVPHTWVWFYGLTNMEMLAPPLQSRCGLLQRGHVRCSGVARLFQLVGHRVTRAPTPSAFAWLKRQTSDTVIENSYYCIIIAKLFTSVQKEKKNNQTLT